MRLYAPDPTGTRLIDSSPARLYNVSGKIRFPFLPDKHLREAHRVKNISKALARLEMPEGDLYSLPSSPVTFPDGAHFRVEISGIETLKVLEATVDEAQKLGVPFHRAISVVRGATFLTREELSAFARLARLCREKIRWIKNIIEIVGETQPDLKVSAPGVADLEMPLP